MKPIQISLNLLATLASLLPGVFSLCDQGLTARDTNLHDKLWSRDAGAGYFGIFNRDININPRSFHLDIRDADTAWIHPQLEIRSGKGNGKQTNGNAGKAQADHARIMDMIARTSRSLQKQAARVTLHPGKGGGRGYEGKQGYGVAKGGGEGSTKGGESGSAKEGYQVPGGSGGAKVQGGSQSAKVVAESKVQAGGQVGQYGGDHMEIVRQFGYQRAGQDGGHAPKQAGKQGGEPKQSSDKGPSSGPSQ